MACIVEGHVKVSKLYVKKVYENTSIFILSSSMVAVRCTSCTYHVVCFKKDSKFTTNQQDRSHARSGGFAKDSGVSSSCYYDVIMQH